MRKKKPFSMSLVEPHFFAPTQPKQDSPSQKKNVYFFFLFLKEKKVSLQIKIFKKGEGKGKGINLTLLSSFPLHVQLFLQGLQTKPDRPILLISPMGPAYYFPITVFSFQ